MSVLNSPPARLCSWGNATLATNNDPPAKILYKHNQDLKRTIKFDRSDTYKSAPKTDNTAAGKPNAQYVELVLIRANRRGAMEVIRHPMTIAIISSANKQILE